MFQGKVLSLLYQLFQLTTMILEKMQRASCIGKSSKVSQHWMAVSTWDKASTLTDIGY